jgi:hypothetical protein
MQLQNLITMSKFNTHTSKYAVTQLVEALRYKPEGRGLDSRWSYLIFHWLNPSGLTMALGSTQPLTEMITTGPVG